VPLFGRKKQDDEPVDPEARSPQLGVKNKDLALMGQLLQQGADLHQPRHALYYLYFTSPDAAQSAAGDGQAAGYTCEVRDPMPEYPGQWSVVCERQDAMIDPNGVIAADDLFQGIADRLGGEFDGWEAAARP
jgi:Regulator of ribonuclease activity B